MQQPKPKGCPGLAYIVKMEEKQLEAKSRLGAYRQIGFELRKLKARIEPDKAERRRIEELKQYKDAVAKAKHGRFHEDINNQSREVKKAFEELKALNAEIGKEVIAVHDSIIMCQPFPENACSRLDALLGRADELRERSERAKSAIIKSFDELRRARAVREPEAEGGYRDEAKHGQMPDQKGSIAANGMDISDLSILKADDLLQLRSLLMDIISFYIWHHSGLALCHATVAAHRIAGSPSPQSALQKKKEIQRVISKIEGLLDSLRKTGIEQLPDVLLFNNALRAHRAVSGLIPNGMLDKDFSAEKAAFMTMKRFSNKNPEAPGIRPKIGKGHSLFIDGYLHTVKNDLSLIGQTLADGGRKVFLLQAFGDFFSTIGFDIFSETPDSIMASRSERIIAILLATQIYPHLGILYTHDEVLATLERSGFSNLMPLVPPLNFVMEHDEMKLAVFHLKNNNESELKAMF